MVAHMSSTQSMILAVFLLYAIDFADICNGDRATALFVFGDSYVDTGNYHPPMNNSIVSAWKYPYGVTWPGQPSGRVSSGRILTDYTAQILGLPSPVAYRVLNSSTNHTIALEGINFAVSYSGVFETFFGVPKLGIQVGSFKDSITSQKYDSQHLNHSIALLSLNGNDYSATNVTAVGMEKFVKSVITEMKLQLTELYKLGLRNFMVSNNMPFDCQPGYLQSGAVCFNTTMDLVSTHNKYLSQAISELSNLEDANFLILDFFAAFSRVICDPKAYGIQKMNRSCCSPANITNSIIGCADYDEQGKALFNLCNAPEDFFFFDWYHPTQKGWEVMINLHYSQSGFVQDGSSSPPQSVAKWLSQRVGLHSYPPQFLINFANFH